MKKGRFTEEQIIGVLKQHEAGRKVPELARESQTRKSVRAFDGSKKRAMTFRAARTGHRRGTKGPEEKLQQ